MESKLIFGSTAIKHWFNDFREPNDIDYISKDVSLKSKKVEYHWCESFQYILDNNKDSIYVDPNFLYTIKFSHAPWDVRWTKTMKDIKFLKDKECQLDRELLNLLRKDWEIIHGKKKVNLNQKNKDFFNENISRKFDHDDLHKLLAFYDEPLHTRLRKDETAMCYKELWNKLSHLDKIKCALEETYVVATERYIDKYPIKTAKYKALKNLITSMTKGWFCDFMIENFNDLIYNDLDEHWKTKLKENYYEL